MTSYAEKTKKSGSVSVAENVSRDYRRPQQTVQFTDNRPETAAQLKIQEMMNGSSIGGKVFQLMPSTREGGEENSAITSTQKNNKTGLPDNLKTGVENLSDYMMDDVKVHYNSDKPAQLQALAYAQGTNIHIAPGQETHLPHEAWHVVQQKQGRVKPTIQMKGHININDDHGLEKEAGVMGRKALQGMSKHANSAERRSATSENIIQRLVDTNLRKDEVVFD